MKEGTTMLVSVKNIHFEEPMELIDYVNDQLTPSRKNFTYLTRPLHDRYVPRDQLEPWEKSLYEVYDKIPTEALPLFDETLNHLYKKNVECRDTMLKVLGLTVLTLLLFGFLQKD